MAFGACNSDTARDGRGNLGGARPNQEARELRTFPTRVLAAAVVAVAVAACTSSSPLPRRPAVPESETDRVNVLGIPDARFLPTDGEALSAMGARLYEREEAYYAATGRRIPAVNSMLAISGGGDNGAFGAGLLVGWSERGDRPLFKIITGVSTGALIAPFIFLGDDRTVTQIITTIDKDDVYKQRPLLDGLTSDALSDTTPLQTLIATYLDAGVVARIAEESRHGRALVVITTNLDAGVPVLWDIGAIAESGSPQAADLIRKILLASASVPGLFPPVLFDVTLHGARYQELHADGGASVQTFLYPPGLHAIGELRPVTAYVIRNGRFTPDWQQVERSTLSIANRAVSTLTTNSGLGDIYRMYELSERDGVRFQLAYIGDDFGEPHPAADFDHNYLVKLFEYGRAKGRAGYPWLSGPPGLNDNETERRAASN